MQTLPQLDHMRILVIKAKRSRRTGRDNISKSCMTICLRLWFNITVLPPPHCHHHPYSTRWNTAYSHSSHACKSLRIAGFGTDKNSFLFIEKLGKRSQLALKFKRHGHCNTLTIDAAVRPSHLLVGWQRYNACAIYILLQCFFLTSAHLHLINAATHQAHPQPISACSPHSSHQYSDPSSPSSAHQRVLAALFPSIQRPIEPILFPSTAAA